MSVTQVVRDSTVVEHAKVAAQQKRKMFIVQLDVNAYDEASSKVRPGLTRILEGIEDAGWRLDQTAPSTGAEGEAARLFIFRPDPEAAEGSSSGSGQESKDRSAQQQASAQPTNTGGQPQQDPYAGYQYQTGQQYSQGYQQQQQYPGYGQQQQQYPGYGQQQQPGYGQQQPGYGQQYPGYGQQGW
ncbi:hypothetical protein [Streptomonospora nanhaiensis]|uniref:Uncharacterized protein n=1 Tax=Streptomonospora nanhaiensis TaxID=1323731 RepID=A0A853BLK6_9ACTN|nr:hypothetical protein [Streptomonospora nanhaiensis]MBV2361814.1 hypothetical protein [Streptomonospora nanhaiensis]NYI96368.1 hypothetical protein [Streptomonospora nanhaiensis]